MSDNEAEPKIMKFDADADKDKKKKKKDKKKEEEGEDVDDAEKKAKKEKKKKEKEAAKAGEEDKEGDDAKEKKKKKKKDKEEGEEEDEAAKKERKEKKKREKEEKEGKGGEEEDEAAKKERKERKKREKEEKAKAKEEEEVVEVDQLAIDDGEDIQLIDFTTYQPLVKNISKKSKKSKSTKLEIAAKVFAANQEALNNDDTNDNSKNRLDLNNVSDHQAFNYDQLLQKIVNILKSKGDDKSTSFKIKEPLCTRTRTKSTWHNFNAMVIELNRKHQHILDFFTSELGCDGNIGADFSLVLTGGFQAKQFLKLIKKYIVEYVQCKECKSMDTILVKEDKTRMWVLKCNGCKSYRTVSNIISRYVATKRGQRKKEKQLGLV